VKFSYQPFAFGSAVIAMTITGFLVPGPKDSAIPLHGPLNAAPGTTTTTSPPSQNVEVLGIELSRETEQTTVLQSTPTFARRTAVNATNTATAPSTTNNESPNPQTTSAPSTSSPPTIQRHGTTSQKPQPTTTTAKPAPTLTTQTTEKRHQSDDDQEFNFPFGNHDDHHRDNHR
jgi:hypothetical protein